MGSIPRAARSLLLACGLCVYMCHAQQVGNTALTNTNPQALENVATADGASVRVQGEGACGEDQKVFNPQDGDHEYRCLPGCPRMADEDYTTTTLLYNDLTTGVCIDPAMCEETVEVQLRGNQTFSLMVMPLTETYSRYILRVDSISLKVKGTVLSLEYHGVLEGSFDTLTLNTWSHVAVAVEIGASSAERPDWLVLLYVYVDGVYKGSASGRDSESATGTVEARLGECVDRLDCTEEAHSGDLLIKKVELIDTLLSSSQVNALHDGVLPDRQPHPECVCPTQYPVADGDITCKSEFRGGTVSRFHGVGEEFFLAADLLLHPVGEAFYNGMSYMPLFLATAPGDDDVTITIDIPYSQVESINISSLTKHPETAIYVNGSSKYPTSAELLRRALAANCEYAVDVQSEQCTDIGSVPSDAQGIFTYTLDLTHSDNLPSLTSLAIQYKGLPVWTGGVDHNVAALKAHLISSVVVMARRQPYVTSVTPGYGPKAGGTLLTLHGVHLDLSNASVTVGDQSCMVLDITSSAITCSTAAMNVSTTAVEQSLTVAVSFSMGEIINNAGQFHYRPDPNITHVERLKTFAAAGLSVEVSGTNLQSVHSPYLLTTAHYRNMAYPQMNMLCQIHSNAFMSCPYPDLDTGDTDVQWPHNGDPGLTYSLGLALDGVTTYRDGIMVDSQDFSTAQVYHSPMVTKFTSTPHKFKVWDTDEIHIEGESLLSGCSESDYSVMVGNQRCDIIDLKQSLIICRPPSDTPLMTLDADIYHELPQCVVKQGSRSTTAGWVLYERTVWDDVSIRIAILVIVFGIALFIFVAVLITLENKNKKVARENFDVLVSNSLGLETSIKVQTHQIDPERLHMALLIKRVEMSKLAYGTYDHEDKGFVQKVFVKKFQLAEFASESYHVKEMVHFLRGATSLAGLQDESIHQLIGLARIENGAYAVYTHAQHYNLRHHLRQQHVALTVGDLTRLCRELASALEYVSSQGVVHGDVAARNCLVNVHGSALLGDNALSRTFSPEEYSDIRGFDKPVPVRWMAPEYLKGKQPTTESDVWSFGVLCWELLTRGRWPYENLYLDDVIALVFNGGHLVQSRLCPNEIFELLTQCWRLEPTDRTKFPDIDGYLTAVLGQVSSGQMYEQLVAPPPADYELCFSKLAGKYNQGFLPTIEEITKV